MTKQYIEGKCPLFQHNSINLTPHEYNRLLKLLNSLNIEKGEYVSHLTALSLLNVYKQSYTNLTIASSIRRKFRKIGNINIMFIYRQLSKPKEILTLVYDDLSIPVSTIPTSLVDLVSEKNICLSLEEISYCFTNYLGQANKILNIAQGVSDSSFKRCLFWLLWTGNITAKYLTNITITETPVYLVSNDKISPTLWEGLISIYFPVRLLEIYPTYSPVHTNNINNKSQSEWIELRQYPPFQKYIVHNKWLPILDDPRIRKRNLFKNFMLSKETLSVISNHDRFFLSLHKNKMIDNLPPLLPRLCLSWVNKNLKQTNLYKDLIKWVKVNLSNGPTKYLEAALHFGIKLKMNNQILKCIKYRSSELIEIKQFDLISKFIKPFDESHKKLSASIYKLLSILHIREGNVDKAIHTIKKGLQYYSNSNFRNSSWGDLQISLATAYMRIKNYDKAIIHLKKAKDFLSIKHPKKLQSIYLIRGNYEFSQGNLSEARNNYLQALACGSKFNIMESKGKILYNLSLVEFRRSNYIKAEKMFIKSSTEYAKQNNMNVLIDANQGAAIALLNIGNFSKAIELLEQNRKIQLNLGIKDINQILTTKCMLAWAYEISGFNSSAKILWKEIESIPINSLSERTSFIRQLLRISSDMINNNLDKALQNVNQMLLEAKTTHISDEDLAELLFRKGQIEFFSKSADGKLTLDKATNILANFPNRDLTRRLLIFRSAYEQKSVDINNLNMNIGKLVLSEIFDPFWPFYAEQLMNLQLSTGATFLEAQRKKTTKGFMQNIKTKFVKLNHFLTYFTALDEFPKKVRLIKHNQQQIISFEAVKKWRESNFNGIRIDAFLGIIKIRNRFIRMNKDTYPFKILCTLIDSYPIVSAPDIFKIAWGIKYDEEWDKDTLKASVYRLRKCLKTLENEIKVSYVSIQNQKHVQLTFNGPWEAII